MKKFLLLVSMSLLLVGISSCTHRLTDFTIISTKNIPIGKEAALIQKANKRVKGVDKSHIILFLPIGTPNMKEAIDRAIDNYPGAIGLVDGVVKSKSWSCILYGQNSYIVEGTPIYEADENEMNIISNGNMNPTRRDDNLPGETILFFHEVKNGENLSGIAAIYNVSIADIIKWNKLSSTDVSAGTKLRIFIK